MNKKKKARESILRKDGFQTIIASLLGILLGLLVGLFSKTFCITPVRRRQRNI